MATTKTDEKIPVPASEHSADSSSNESDNDLEKVQPEYGSHKDHIFSNPDVAEYWKGVYEKAHYEGRHQFDPTLEWSAEEEIRIRKKVRETERGKRRNYRQFMNYLHEYFHRERKN